MREQGVDGRLFRSDVDGLLIGVDDHTRLGARWLVDVFAQGDVDGHLGAVACFGEPGGELGGFFDDLRRESIVTSVGLDDDVGAVDVLGMEPEVGVSADLLGDVVVLVVVLADVKLVAVDEEVGWLRLVLRFFAARLGMALGVAGFLQLETNVCEIVCGLSLIEAVFDGAQILQLFGGALCLQGSFLGADLGLVVFFEVALRVFVRRLAWVHLDGLKRSAVFVEILHLGAWPLLDAVEIGGEELAFDAPAVGVFEFVDFFQLQGELFLAAFLFVAHDALKAGAFLAEKLLLFLDLVEILEHGGHVGPRFLVECSELFEGKGRKGENLTPAIDEGRLPVGVRAACKKAAALLPESVVVDLAKKFDASVRRDVGAHE